MIMYVVHIMYLFEMNTPKIIFWKFFLLMCKIEILLYLIITLHYGFFQERCMDFEDESVFKKGI